MRDIRFRAWDNKEKEMTDDFEIGSYDCDLYCGGGDDIEIWTIIKFIEIRWKKYK